MHLKESPIGAGDQASPARRVATVLTANRERAAIYAAAQSGLSPVIKAFNSLRSWARRQRDGWLCHDKHRQQSAAS
jgi:hypothetical protein